MKEKQVREIIRTVIWRIAQDEGGQVLSYNDWVDDNWEELIDSKETEENDNEAKNRKSN
jgi:hypothetical protein